MVGSLYLGALRAAEDMAREMGEQDFAETCRHISRPVRRIPCKRLFNGEYYIQDVDLAAAPEVPIRQRMPGRPDVRARMGAPSRSGISYPRDTVLKSLQSVWKYCWAPDVRLQNEHHAPQRWFAYPGEAGLFTCTWPKSKHLGPDSTVYRDEVWTGIEYQVANHMAYEGMVTEALAICRAVHERYHPPKRNPFNEIECGDHYARAMASWGVLTSLAGFACHGPHAHLGFAPRITPADFRVVFTGPAGWGTFSQHREGRQQTNLIELKWGHLALKP